MRALLRTFSWQEWRHHPWRTGAALLAVTLGVALAFAVHLVNTSALDEFAGAARAVDGQADVILQSPRGAFDEQVFAGLATRPEVEIASPVLERSGYALGPSGRRVALRLVGIDALVAARLTPALAPRPRAGTDPRSLFSPGQVVLNLAARQALGLPADLPAPIEWQDGLRRRVLQVVGDLPAGGAPLAVMDIGAAQDLLGAGGQLTRIDLRLVPGAAREALIAALPPELRADSPDEGSERLGALSRAYRVNLTVLALVALFTGAFLVYSVASLSVVRRAPQLALLGVLGLTPTERLRLVLTESALLGAVGSATGLALGTALAALGLRALGGDLGGGFFQGMTPHLQWNPGAALLYGGLGVAAAIVGGWWPARAAGTLPLVATLKGLGTGLGRPAPRALPLALGLGGAGAALLPPVAGLPLGAYLGIGLLLVGGITALPSLVGALCDRLAPRVTRHLLPLLAVERARRVRESASVAVSGVVAALSLAVALTVMVASFRESVRDWLDAVLPADLYARTATSAAGADAAWLPQALVRDAAALPGVKQLSAQRLRPLSLDSVRPAVTLIARPVHPDGRELALIGPARPPPEGAVPVWVSEAFADLYRTRPGDALPPLNSALGLTAPARFVVAGVWRDYARQSGALVIDRAAYVTLTGDTRVNDLAIWLEADASAAVVRQAIRGLAAASPGAGTDAGDLLEFASAAEIRATSLRIFDRSFAVTYWLQAVAIGIGLFGIAASFSAQVLARRKEFGLLAHLGLTRGQILGVVASEGAVWTAIGAVAGLGLGLAVSLVLVHVVNPQSFHWTMDLHIPFGRLLALALAVVLTGTLTAWASGRAAAGRDAVQAVKEDW